MITQKMFAAWRPLELNRIVRITGKYRCGETGVVVEINPDLPADVITGICRYGVKLEACGRITDFCRYELTGLRRNRKPIYRTV